MSTEIREFVAIQNAQVLPVSAHTGSGLNDLRTSLAAALSQDRPHSTRLPSVETPKGSEVRQHEGHPRPEDSVGSSCAAAATDGSGKSVSTPVRLGEGVQGAEVVVADAPKGAATATVLDYTSSAKAGKVLVSVLEFVFLLVLVLLRAPAAPTSAVAAVVANRFVLLLVFSWMIMQ